MQTVSFPSFIKRSNIVLYDRKIIISAAGTRTAKFWPSQHMFWSEFIERLKVPARSTETLAEYLGYPKGKQDALKDIGGFVGGEVNGQRKAKNIKGRDLITLDFDNIPSDETDKLILRLESFECSYVVHSTRKHEPVKPRLRIIFPLDRTSSVDEYEPIARQLAVMIGIEMCDRTTYEAHRLMYWPSCCQDSQYIYYFADKPFLSADGILGMYTDWRNVTSWPRAQNELKPRDNKSTKLGDPASKKGIVGAFCRVFNIYSAMNEVIPGTYEACDNYDDRFTFTGGTTAGGAVVYDNGFFLYSHHATDPCGGREVNAFDMVRLHIFGDQDSDAEPNTPINRLPSYTSMCEYAASIPDVLTEFDKEKMQELANDFAESVPDQAIDVEWMKQLNRVTNNGKPLKTVDNIVLILKNDPLIKGKIRHNDFSLRITVDGGLPWDKTNKERDRTKTEKASKIRYQEKRYELNHNTKSY
jgi:hypothetical protein